MELNIYDADLNGFGVIDEITSVLWTRRYWSYGEFKLLLPFSEKHIVLLEGKDINQSFKVLASEMNLVSSQFDKN